ncbi:hypothetical protein G7054_g10852 [Neopestalotiopsis clavispora]|nr:hypothetical protein G7054_g10852 [Neopestalotiopsis clavispora]
MEDGQPVPGSLYVYAPDKGAPIFFAVAFAVSAVGHIYQCFRHQSWSIMGLYPSSAVILAVGYTFRTYGAFDYTVSATGLAFYTMSHVFIHIGPPLHVLANWRLLFRVLAYIPHLSPFSSRKILVVFGGLTAFVELLSVLGVPLAADPAAGTDQQAAGKGLIIAAVALQVMAVIFFYIVSGTIRRSILNARITSPAVTTPMIVLFVSTLLLLIRTAYRLVNSIADSYTHSRPDDDLVSAQESSSPMLRYEWIFYVFEATLILVNSVIWNLWHPGRYMPKNQRTHLALDGKTEVQGAEQPDNRSTAAKVGHVLTFGVFFGRKSGRLGGEAEAIVLNEMAR